MLPGFERNRVLMVRLAWAAIAAQVVFVAGWLVLGAIEGHGYSTGRHDISDLGAPTAHHVWLNALTLLISGALTHRMRRLDSWRDLARPTLVFGILVVASLVAAVALNGTGAQGWSQRFAALLVTSGVVLLALRVRLLATTGDGA